MKIECFYLIEQQELDKLIRQMQSLEKQIFEMGVNLYNFKAANNQSMIDPATNTQICFSKKFINLVALNNSVKN